MDRQYILAALKSMGLDAQPRPAREDTVDEPRTGGLTADVIAPLCHNVMVRALAGAGQPASWAETPAAEQEALLATVAKALSMYDRLPGMKWPELAELFFNTFREGGFWDLPTWEGLPKEYQLGWQAFARHFGYLGECEDIPADLEEQESQWDGWVMKHLAGTNGTHLVV